MTVGVTWISGAPTDFFEQIAHLHHRRIEPLQQRLICVLREIHHAAHLLSGGCDIFGNRSNTAKHFVCPRVEKMETEQQRVSLTEKVKIRVPNQNWVVVNIIGPGLRQTTKNTAFRILGCFDAEAEAQAFAKKYEKLDDRFDIYVCSMYEFLPIPDQVHDVGNVKYGREEINELLEVHESTRTQTEEWNARVEQAQKTGEDKWGALMGL